MPDRSNKYPSKSVIYMRVNPSSGHMQTTLEQQRGYMKIRSLLWGGLIVLFTCAWPNQAFSQQLEEKDLYGRWENTGSFKDGAQQLDALLIQNPKTYYFTFNSDGTFIYEVVSLRRDSKGKVREGKWQLSPDGQRLTLLDNEVKIDNREVPSDFLDYKGDGSLSTKPVIYPILEYNPKKLVLYDEYHKTRDVFLRR